MDSVLSWGGLVCVSAPNKESALKRLGEEFIRRQDAGQDPPAYAVYHRHLREPVPGVYAIDTELCRELVHAPDEVRKRAIQEGERRRTLGQTYTNSDYLRHREKPEPEATSGGPSFCTSRS